MSNNTNNPDTNNINNSQQQNNPPTTLAIARTMPNLVPDSDVVANQLVGYVPNQLTVLDFTQIFLARSAFFVAELLQGWGGNFWKHLINSTFPYPPLFLSRIDVLIFIV